MFYINESTGVVRSESDLANFNVPTYSIKKLNCKQCTITILNPILSLQVIKYTKPCGFHGVKDLLGLLNKNNKLIHIDPYTVKSRRHKFKTIFNNNKSKPLLISADYWQYLKFKIYIDPNYELFTIGRQCKYIREIFDLVIYFEMEGRYIFYRSETTTVRPAAASSGLAVCLFDKLSNLIDYIKHHTYYDFVNLYGELIYNQALLKATNIEIGNSKILKLEDEFLDTNRIYYINRICIERPTVNTSTYFKVLHHHSSTSKIKAEIISYYLSFVSNEIKEKVKNYFYEVYFKIFQLIQSIDPQKIQIQDYNCCLCEELRLFILRFICNVVSKE